MKKQTPGRMVAALRKEKGMTQLELAEQMGVTDKAVSKWERDLSFPDVSSLPKLAEILGVTVEELIQAKGEGKPVPAPQKVEQMLSLGCRAVALAMGVAVAVLSFLDQIQTSSALGLLGIGLACLALSLLSGKEEP